MTVNKAIAAGIIAKPILRQVRADELKVGDLLIGWDKVTKISVSAFYGITVYTLCEVSTYRPDQIVSIGTFNPATEA